MYKITQMKNLYQKDFVHKRHSKVGYISFPGFIVSFNLLVFLWYEQNKLRKNQLRFYYESFKLEGFKIRRLLVVSFNETNWKHLRMTKFSMLLNRMQCLRSHQYDSNMATTWWSQNHVYKSCTKEEHRT